MLGDHSIGWLGQSTRAAGRAAAQIHPALPACTPSRQPQLMNLCRQHVPSPGPDFELAPDPDSLSPDQLRAALREANQRLAERERHLELIEHLAGIGSWEIDLDRDSVRWSRELKRMHGFDDQTAPARHSIFMEQVLHPGDVQLVNEKMSALSAEEPVTVEFRARRTDGEIRLFQARGLLVRGEDGALSRVIGTSLDITDRRKMVLALRASEESYRTIFEHASDAMWVHDLDTGNFLAVNQAAVDMYGFSVEEQLARGVAGMSAGFAPFRIEDALPFISGAAQGVPQRFEWLGRHKDGHLIWGEVRLRRVTLNGVERILATARDINDRVKAEVALRQANEALEERVKERTAQLELAVAEEASARAALAESEEHFRRIIEGAADLVFICDHQGAMTYVGPSSMAMLGFTPAELMGATPDVLLHPDDLSATMDDLQWLAEHPGEPVTSTFRMRRKDGTYLVMENLGRTLSPHSIADGVIAFGRDITGRRAAEEALARAKEEAERANRAKSEFLSRMSHELRTPMNSILGFAQLLARTDLPMQQGKSVQHILKAGKHLLHLINEVLEIARIEAGREQFSLEPVALAPVLEEALGLVRPLAQQNGVALHGGPWAADTFVHADRQRLVQVLLNLLSNAIKYNHHGGSVHLRSEITPRVAAACRSPTPGVAWRPTDLMSCLPHSRALAQSRAMWKAPGWDLRSPVGCVRRWKAPFLLRVRPLSAVCSRCPSPRRRVRCGYSRVARISLLSPRGIRQRRCSTSRTISPT